MKQFLKISMLLLLVVAAFSVHAQAQDERLKFAVYVTGIKDGQPLKDTDPEMTSAHGTASDVMINSGLYKMIERSQAFLSQIRQEQKYQQSGVVEDKQIAAIGKANGAQKVCVIQLTIGGGGLMVNARIVDVVTEDASQSGRDQNRSYTGWLDVEASVEKAVKKMLGNDNSSSTGYSTVPTFSSGGTGTDRTFTVNGVSFKMVFVKGGSFQMGSYSGNSDEKPVHTVTVSDFYMGEFEVTQALWQEVMGSSISQQRNKANSSWSLYGVGDNYPMYYVSHSEAEEFCGRLNQRLRGQLPAGYSFALPTEAEWEYAAQGGSKTNAYTYSGSNYLSDVGWYADNSGSSTHAVGMKRPNELGLYDMSGNVWEWCADWYGENYYSSSPSQDPRGPSSGSYRVLRGGSWGSSASSCRVAYRSYDSPGYRGIHDGFRLSLVRR